MTAINVKIDLGEIGSYDEDGSFMNVSDIIKSEIIYQVKNEVWRDIQEKVRLELTMAIKAEIHETVRSRINAHIDSFLAEGILDVGKDSQITIKQYLTNFISGQREWANLGANLSKVAEKYAKDVAAKYEQVFATQTVTKLKESEMLNQNKLDALFGPKV